MGHSFRCQINAEHEWQIFFMRSAFFVKSPEAFAQNIHPQPENNSPILKSILSMLGERPFLLHSIEKNA